MKDLNASGVKLLSVDVFDTLLLRGRESERRRMAWISQKIAESIGTHGFRRAASNVLDARLDAQRIAYSALRVTGDQGDVRLVDIHRLQLLALGLPESLLPALAEAEIAVDSGTLRANDALVKRLRQLRTQGVRVVAVSDTYYTSNDLRRLLRTHGAEQSVDAIYSSADYGATKKSGRLFPLVIEAERFDPRDILHLGDDQLADVAMPKAKGLAAKWAPRPLRVRLMRKLDALWLRTRPAAAGWGLT